MSKQPGKLIGIVSWFSAEKGWGFLDVEGMDEQIFVHYRNILGEGFKTLKEGQRVEFVKIKSDKGFAAAEVVVVDEVAEA